MLYKKKTKKNYYFINNSKIKNKNNQKIKNNNTLNLIIKDLLIQT
jgi:hypothetical protein